MNENYITKKMLAKMREKKDAEAKRIDEQFAVERAEKDNFLTRSKILMQEAVEVNEKKKTLTEENDQKHDKSFVIGKNTPQFGDVRTSQEEMIRKAVGEDVTMASDALKYYPQANDLTLNGKIDALNMSFQFRYNDPSGTGVYIFCDGLQLTDTNYRSVGKVRDAYLNWKNSIVQDADLMEKLKKAVDKDKND